MRVRLANWPESHWRLAEIKSVLGLALSRAGDADRAEALLREGLAALDEAVGVDDRIAAEASRRLDVHLARIGDPS